VNANAAAATKVIGRGLAERRISIHLSVRVDRITRLGQVFVRQEWPVNGQYVPDYLFAADWTA
jgi:hypothetical protein